MMKFDWPHAPTHRLAESGTFMVTAGTYRHIHHFRGKKRLEVLQRGILKLLKEYDWHVEAWAVFSNHYHFIAHSPDEKGADSLSRIINTLHSKTAAWINRIDKEAGRKVWHNYWESQLTYQRSYLARLSYVHQNPARHGLVPTASQYPWCSAGWFERTASRAQVKTVYGMKVDRLKIDDNFQVSGDW